MYTFLHESIGQGLRLILSLCSVFLLRHAAAFLIGCRIFLIIGAVLADENINQQNNQDKNNRNNGGNFWQQGIDCTAFWLSEESFGAAGDRTGEIMAFSVLHEHGDRQKDGHNDQANSEDIIQRG